MTHYIKYVTVRVSIILSTGFFTASFPASSKGSLNELLYFAGGDLLYTRRIGSNTFEPVEKRQDIVKQNMFLYGFNIGKRYYATPWLRFQIEGMFHFGRCFEDTLPDVDFNNTIIQYISLKHLFKHIGINLDVHLVRQLTNTLYPFVLLGGGLNYMHLEEQIVHPDDHSQEISTIGGYSGKDVKNWGSNFNLGAGFDIKFTRSIGLCIAYSYRIWKPVKYRDASDMPLEPIEYEERFYTHRFKAKFLFSLGGE